MRVLGLLCCVGAAAAAKKSLDDTLSFEEIKSKLSTQTDDFDECDKYYCGNDPYWRYDAGDKGLLGCDDIAGEPEKIENRCRTQERIGVDATGREVRASWACKGVCRFECEGC